MQQSTDITIYIPNARVKTGLVASWIIMAKNIIRSRELIYQLFKRDFIFAYKKSVFGFGWVIVAPLITVLSWVVLNATGVLNTGDVGGSYTAFVLVNSSLWGLFLGFYTSSAQTIDAGAGLISQVYYPHEVLLVKQTAQHLANFSITLVLNIVVLLIFGTTPSWMIILFPILILPLFFLGSGLGLLISVVNVVFPDLPKIVTVVLNFIFYVTPVVYAAKVKSPFLQKIIDINPLTYLLGGIRDAIVYGYIKDADKFLFFGFITLIFFIICWRLFYVSEDKVVEKIAS